jgi:hypothetical protein
VPSPSVAALAQGHVAFQGLPASDVSAEALGA